METTRSTQDSATTPKGKFGFWSIVFLTINGIIGTGIFLSPGAVITEAGTWTPVVYIAAGVFACILALTFAAAARWTSENGASFAYARVAFGDDVGFYVGITRFVAGAIAWGVMATAVVSTSLGIFLGSEAASSTTNITIGFVALMAVLFLINIAGTHVTKMFTNASTVGKVAALVITIAAAVFLVVKTGDNQFSVLDGLKGDDGKPAVPTMDTAVFVGAVLAAFYAFTGFETIATAASEMDRPEKLLPRAIPLGVVIVLLVYVGVVSATMMLDPVALLKSEEPVVLASAFENEIVRGLIITGALVSMFGINVGASFITPRVFEAMSARGMVPAVVSRTNSRGVPVVAFVITAVGVGVSAIVAFSRHTVLTPQGAERSEYLRGVREFIRVAETDRLRMLQSVDGAERRADGSIDVIHLYEKLLPYAMLFGEERSWSTVLETTYADTGRDPDWVSTYVGVSLATRLSTYSTSMTTAATYTPASSSSGGSTGGGFSGGGGGGGFSGGR